MLDVLPKSAQPAAKTALAEIWNAEDREHAEAALAAFAKQYGAKFPKAVAKLINLCRGRHKLIYAEPATMPSSGPVERSPLAAAVAITRMALFSSA